MLDLVKGHVWSFHFGVKVIIGPKGHFHDINCALLLLLGPGSSVGA
jgi:hypothetical protein